ncbi:hypothetical protein, partial [Streptococcus pneumoniae]|uniref:hypothetical protein n=1 Tax=Streptococcus pneumoniae TaxID=1313 RepID=UPI0018B0DDA6
VMPRISKYFFSFLILVLMVPALWWGNSAKEVIASEEVDKLKAEINERSQRLLQIEKEIAQFEQDLKKVGAEKNTLQK